MISGAHPSIDPSKLIIPDSEMADLRRMLEKYYSSPASLSLTRNDEPEIPPQQLVEFRSLLVKLQTQLIQSKEQFSKYKVPLNNLIEQYQSSRFMPQKQITNPLTKYQQQQKPQQSQKQASQQRTTQNVPTSTNRGSERSMRSSTERHGTQATSSNLLDIWVRAAPLFAPVPMTEEYTQTFSAAIENAKRGRDLRMPEILEPTVHWSQILSEKIKRIPKDSKRIPTLLPPPGPPPSNDDISEYWQTNFSNFPIEQIQKKNSSPLHRLLGSFVELDTPVESPPPESDSYLPVNILPPKLPHDRYLCYSFEERLQFELKSIGLDLQEGPQFEQKDVFGPEIEQYQAKIAELIPRVEKTMRAIIAALPEIRKIEDRKFNEQAEYEEAISLVTSKRRKK